MIQSFADATTQDLFDATDSKAARPDRLRDSPRVCRKLDIVNRAA